MTFPWSGRGIFILGYALLGTVAGLVAGHFMAPKLHMDEIPLSVAMGQVGLALGAWIFAVTAGRSELYPTLEPTKTSGLGVQLSQPVIHRQRHTLLFVPPWIWAILASVFVGSSGVSEILTLYKTKNAEGTTPESLVTRQTAEKLYADLLDTVRSKFGTPAKPASGEGPAEPKTAENGPGAVPPMLPTDMRNWKDNKGRVMTASLERFTTAKYDVAEFKRQDGQHFQVPLDRFSAEDQVFIGRLALRVSQDEMRQSR